MISYFISLYLLFIFKNLLFKHVLNNKHKCEKSHYGLVRKTHEGFIGNLFCLHIIF